MSDRIQEAVLLFIAADFAHQKNRVEDDSGDDEAEENYAQDKRHDLAPIENDPTGAENRGRDRNAYSQRYEERNRGLATSDAHRHGGRLPVVSCPSAVSKNGMNSRVPHTPLVH